jgi:acetylornithine deacetylase/succinyl-diaminopimelate desuccinylase family protein
MTKPSELTRFLCDLIAIPSVNPSLGGETHHQNGEEEVATFLIEKAKRLGIAAQRQAVLPDRKNVIFRLKPKNRVKQKVLLAPHLDVVPADTKLFSPRIKNGKIYGRGACDTKGSVASFFHAFCEFAKDKGAPKETEIIFAGLVDEEFGQAGSRKLAAKGPKAELAIAGEPTNLQVVTAHKGNIWLRLKTKGKAAHGATPENGENAIGLMTSLLQALFHDYPQILLSKKHPLLGHPTLNVGKISGGSQANIVANSCILELDRRTLPGESKTSIRNEFVSLFKSKNLPIPEFECTRSVPCPPLDTDPNLPLVRDLLKASGKRKPRGVPYFTDASPLASGGTPSVVFGPGDIAQAHSENEFVEIKQLEKAQDIISTFLKNLP